MPVFDEIYLKLRAKDEGYVSAIEKTISQLEKLDHSSSKATAASKRLSDQLVNLTTRYTRFSLIALPTAAITGGLAILERAALKLKNTFDATLPSMERTVQTAQRLNVSTEFVEGFQLAAKNAGVSSRMYEQAITGIRTTLGRAGAENTKAIKSFNRLGLSFKKLGEMSPENQIKAIADAVQRLPEKDRLSAIADIISGGSGGKGKLAGQVLPLFAAGAKGIDEMTESARRFGAHWSSQVERDIKRAGKAQRELNLATKSWHEQFTAGISPAMADAYESITKWINKAVEFGQVQEFAKGIGDALKIAGTAAGVLADYVERIMSGVSTRDMIGTATQSGDRTQAFTSDVSRIDRLSQQSTAMERFGVTEFNLSGMNKRETSVLKRLLKNRHREMGNYQKAQMEALVVLREKMGIDTSQFGNKTNWIEMMKAESGRRLDAQIKKIQEREENKKWVKGDSSPEFAGRGTEGMPKTKEQIEREQKAEAKRQQHLAEYYKQREERAQKQREKDAKDIARGTKSVTRLAERRADLQREIEQNSGSKDRTYSAAVRGSVEAYRAQFAYTKVDQTALRQLEEQRKIAKESEKASQELADIKKVITQRQSMEIMNAVDLL